MMESQEKVKKKIVKSTSKVHHLFLHKKKTKDTHRGEEKKLSALCSLFCCALSFGLVLTGYFSDFIPSTKKIVLSPSYF